MSILVGIAVGIALTLLVINFILGFPIFYCMWLAFFYGLDKLRGR